GELAGHYVVDIVVEKEILVELKCADSLGNEHVAQCINYLKASGRKLALLMNFQKAKVRVQAYRTLTLCVSVSICGLGLYLPSTENASNTFPGAPPKPP